LASTIVVRGYNVMNSMTRIPTEQLPLPIVPSTMTRAAKLERWAHILRDLGANATVATLYQIEKVEGDAKLAIEVAGSALAVAAADPMLLAAGLKGGTVGDATAFFEITEGEVHDITCCCGNGEVKMDASVAAALVRGLIQYEAMAKRSGGAQEWGGIVLPV